MRSLFYIYRFQNNLHRWPLRFSQLILLLLVLVSADKNSDVYGDWDKWFLVGQTPTEPQHWYLQKVFTKFMENVKVSFNRVALSHFKSGSFDRLCIENGNMWLFWIVVCAAQPFEVIIMIIMIIMFIVYVHRRWNFCSVPSYTLSSSRKLALDFSRSSNNHPVQIFVQPPEILSWFNTRPTHATIGPRKKVNQALSKLDSWSAPPFELVKWPNCKFYFHHQKYLLFGHIHNQ